MPLAKGDEGIAVNLNEVINAVYVDGGFDLDIDYQTDPEPPLSDGDRVWLDQLLREQGLRKTANDGTIRPIQLSASITPTEVKRDHRRNEPPAGSSTPRAPSCPNPSSA